MKPFSPAFPIQAQEYLARDFIVNRSRLLELAAYLDRLERFNEQNHNEAHLGWDVLTEALKILSQHNTNRVQALHLKFSDPSLEPLESSDGRKSAIGLYQEDKKNNPNPGCC